MLQPILALITLVTTLVTPSLAHALPAFTIDDTGVIQIDAANERYLTGCWESDEQAVMYYRDEAGIITHAEVCNEPDEVHHGRGTTPAERARNYFDFLQTTRTEIHRTQPQVAIVLGSLSGYNYPWLRDFLALPGSCDLFDVVAYHPYHLGVSPDAIDPSRNAWHTTEQWTGFIRALLRDAGCDRPIWVTEYGYSTASHNAETAVSPAEQRDFALRQLIMHLGEGVTRVSYFDGLTYALDTDGRAAWGELATRLDGSRFIGLRWFGERSCPRGGSTCFFDESQHRADTGRTITGLPVPAREMRAGRVYTFDGGTDFTHISWMIDRPSSTVVTTPFRDVDGETLHGTAITQLAAAGVIHGYADRTYRPDTTINRAEFVKLVLPTDTPATTSNCFADVRDEWFAAPVCTAKNAGLLTGYPDGTFRPAAVINRAEVVTLLARAFELTASDTELSFADVDPTSWYAPAVRAGVAAGLISPGEHFAPDRPATRGEVAAFIARAQAAP